jgi:hypothetical protein
MDNPTFGLTIDAVVGKDISIAIPVATAEEPMTLHLELSTIQTLVQFSMDLATAQFDNDHDAITVLMAQHRAFVNGLGVKFIKWQAEARRAKKGT